MHYDTTENNFDFESVNPDNPFNEEDDGKPIIFLHSTFIVFYFAECRDSFCFGIQDDDDDDDDDDDEDDE